MTAIQQGAAVACDRGSTGDEQGGTQIWALRRRVVHACGTEGHVGVHWSE